MNVIGVIKSQALLPMILLLTMVTSNPQITLSSNPDPEPLQIEERWLVTWGGDDYESPRRVIYDGSHLYIYGRTLSYGDGESNIFLAKYDMEGGLVWDVVWETPTLDVPRGYALEGPHACARGMSTYTSQPWGTRSPRMWTRDRRNHYCRPGRSTGSLASCWPWPVTCTSGESSMNRLPPAPCRRRFGSFPTP